MMMSLRMHLNLVNMRQPMTMMMEHQKNHRLLKKRKLLTSCSLPMDSQIQVNILRLHTHSPELRSQLKTNLTRRITNLELSIVLQTNLESARGKGHPRSEGALKAQGKILVISKKQVARQTAPTLELILQIRQRREINKSGLICPLLKKTARRNLKRVSCLVCCAR